MKKFFGFGSSTPPPPSPPSKPPAPPPKAATPPPAPAKASAPTPVKPVTNSTPSIVGRWKEPGNADTTEFHADGTVTEKTGSGETIRGRYSLRDKHLKINLEGVSDELSFPVAIASDKLEMTDPEGKITHYQRVA